MMIACACIIADVARAQLFSAKKSRPGEQHKSRSKTRESSPIAKERDEMHEWWCSANHGSSLCEFWSFKEALIKTKGAAAKTLDHPKVGS